MRSPGIDFSHNPEFLACEFYRAYSSIDDLMRMTEDFVRAMTHAIRQYHQAVGADAASISPPDYDLTPPFRRLEFIPALEEALGHPLPNLTSPDVDRELEALLTRHGLDAQADRSPPQMLDKLAAKFLEPQCQAPTFIIHHPECMSPLAKSFRDESSGHMVSARAELFVAGHEVANMYEEENAPEAQRAKFEQQRAYQGLERSAIGAGEESYVRALEWGLPPTGGWGAGIERLCMVLTGIERISDVLSFGTLRNVVALGGRALDERK